jgi:hypothetical protein
MKQRNESDMTFIEAWKDLNPKERRRLIGGVTIAAAVIVGGIGIGIVANEQAHVRYENTLHLPDPIDDQHIDPELDGPDVPENYVDPASIELPAPEQK